MNNINTFGTQFDPVVIQMMLWGGYLAAAAFMVAGVVALSTMGKRLYYGTSRNSAYTPEQVSEETIWRYRNKWLRAIGIGAGIALCTILLHAILHGN